MSGDAYNDYDSFAAAYSDGNDANAWNAYYERPAALALVGDVSGGRVLDAGCGAGSHSVELRRRGAEVTGFDKSAGLLRIARERLGPDVPLHHGDLARPLPFADDAFDLVLASLVLHYLQDWHATLCEFHRVLRPHGRVVASTHHPFMDHRLTASRDYFATYEITEEWTRGDRTVSMRFWHRPLHAMLDVFDAAGFIVDSITEPRPLAEAEALFPEAYESLMTQPRFLFFAAHTV